MEEYEGQPAASIRPKYSLSTGRDVAHGEGLHPSCPFFMHHTLETFLYGVNVIEIRISIINVIAKFYF